MLLNFNKFLKTFSFLIFIFFSFFFLEITLKLYPSHAKIIFNQWMSEDGGRLYKKRNKGMMVEILNSSISLDYGEEFKLLTLFTSYVFSFS